MEPARKKTRAKVGTKKMMRRILMGGVQREGARFWARGGTYWVCWPGLLKCVACSKSWMPERKKVAAVKVPQSKMVNLWNVKEPTI